VELGRGFSSKKGSEMWDLCGGVVFAGLLAFGRCG